jgi:hypothetical protein
MWQGRIPDKHARFTRKPQVERRTSQVTTKKYVVGFPLGPRQAARSRRRQGQRSEAGQTRVRFGAVR